MKMRIALLSAVALFALPLTAAGPAFAQKSEKLGDKPINTAELGVSVSPAGRAMGECLISHADATHEKAMKTMLIDALNEDKEALNKSILTVTMAVIGLAQQHCGLKMTDLDNPSFEEGMGVYGEYLGQKVMTKAFSILGM